MIWGIITALVLISAILAVVTRSVRLGLLATLINVAPIVMALGIWVALGGTIGLSLAIMGGLALGVIVDDTVHYLVKYRAARAKDMSVEDATREVLDTTGVDITASSVALAAGFGVLMLSVFTLNKDMGLSAALAILMALIFELLVQPALLVALSRRREQVGRLAAQGV